MQNRMNRVSICDSFDALPARHEEIIAEAASTNFFSSPQWFRNFLQTVPAPSRRVRIYAVESASASLAMLLPMQHETHDTGKVAPRKLASLGNYYTPLFNPFIAASSDGMQEHLNLLANTIAAEHPKWDMVDLHPLEAESALVDAALSAFRNAGMLTARYFCFGNWYLDVNKRSYREYHAALPSQLRNTIQRKSNRLINAGRLRIDIITARDDLTDDIAAFEQVYKSSWKTPEPYPQFIPGLIRTCAQHGWLRLGIAYIDDAPAAAQLWIVCGGVASIYKLAYDEKFSSESAGSILTSRLMQHVIDIDKVREVDFLSGDDPYKKDWMSHRRERHGIIAFNLRTAHGMLGALKHLGGRFWKRIAASCAAYLPARRSWNSAIPDNPSR
jgi:CelD/BcsL family acetyltransferase involved in cellulose biosynthesis